MLFNSFAYILFLPTVLALYWLLCNKSLKAQNVLLLVASYFFYGWWSWEFAALLGGITILDYLYGFKVASRNRRLAKFFLWLSIINNLGILAVFKYYNFFVEQFSQGVKLLGLDSNIAFLDIILPLGISFYTFHGMSYVFDIYTGKQKPVGSLVDYGVFVSFFPLLVAGPIERANHLLPQILAKRKLRRTQMVDGLKLILWGFFKKIVVADSLAPIVNHIFFNYEQMDGWALLTGAIAFSFQIYGDFSGYSDIAIGTAKLMGIELLSNFRFPYFSRSIAEFWRRWHISLTSWFRDYLYIPLGGSKKGKAITVRNVLIVFLVSGFWHGASWNFIAWGFIHACGFMPLLLLKRNRMYVQDVAAHEGSLPDWKETAQMMATFTFVTFAWIIFRAESLSHGIDYIYNMISGVIQAPLRLSSLFVGTPVWLYIIPLVIGDWLLRHNERNLSGKFFNFFITSILVWVVILKAFGGEQVQFIYFQF